MLDHSEHELQLVVADRTVASEDVVLFELRNADGGELPAWEPGAHVDLVLADDLVRQYSLFGDPLDRSVYQVGVLLETEGRGGSVAAHALAKGDTVTVRGPRNHFALVDSPRYVFVAGGIGITPIHAMVRAVDERGSDWTLVYGGRTRDTMTFRSELEARGGERVHVYPQDEAGLIDLAAHLGEAEPDTVVYACGPAPMLDAVEAQLAGWPAGSLHVEHFTPKEMGEPVRDESFEVELAQSGVTVTVPPDRSVLEVVREAGVDIMSSCTEGTCGTCESVVLEGVVDHRDSLLTDDERAAGETMMVCVSRAVSDRLVLDL